MLSGFAIALLLVGLVTMLLGARQRQESSLRQARQQTAGYFAHRQGRLVPARRQARHRRGLLGGAGVPVPAQGFRGPAVRESAQAHRVGADPGHRRSNSSRFCGPNAPTKSSSSPSIPWARWRSHIDGGNGKFDTRYLQFDFHRVRVDGEITHVLVSVSDVTARVDLARELQSCAEPGAGPGRYVARHPAHRSGAAHLLLERFQCGHENDQRRAARADARGGRVPQEARHPVPAGALGQRRGSRAGPVLDREPRACVRG